MGENWNLVKNMYRLATCSNQVDLHNNIVRPELLICLILLSSKANILSLNRIRNSLVKRTSKFYSVACHV